MKARMKVCVRVDVYIRERKNDKKKEGRAK